MKIVISVGGSLLYKEDNFDYEYAKKFSKFILELSKKHKIILVTGGGKLARKYIELARKSNANEAICDLIGIEATRINAYLLSAIIGKKANFYIPKNFIDAIKEFEKRNIVVMGGTTPGHSTDAVAAILSEYVNADLFINATNVNGIYNKDPKKYKDAKMYKTLNIKKLIDMLKDYSLNAGKYELMDIVAAKIIQRSKIKRCIFLNGKNLKNFRNAINGKKFVGTTIKLI